MRLVNGMINRYSKRITIDIFILVVGNDDVKLMTSMIQ